MVNLYALKERKKPELSNGEGCSLQSNRNAKIGKRASSQDLHTTDYKGKYR